MNQFTALVQRFGVGRLAAILGIAAGLAAVSAAIFLNLGQPKALLYSNLDLKEAGSITTALDQAGVKYEVKGDGSTIMVPRDQVASTRLMLSGKGLPTAGSVGYEIFDQANALGQTDFVQQLNRQRALEGELARTIRGLEGISAARVHLVLPRRQLFESEAEQPSASVNITVGGRDPSADQVRAIQNLVAGAVPNMKPDRVTVVDQHAKTLSGGDVGMAAEADGRKSEVEQRIAKQVKNLVEGVVGAGKARVNVSAEVELARVTVQQETFDPDGQVIRSESTSEESARENDANGVGQVGAAANIPGAPGSDLANNSSTSGRTDSTTNYEISKTVRTEVQEPGQIKRLSVAVVVDGHRRAGRGRQARRLHAPFGRGDATHRAARPHGGGLQPGPRRPGERHQRAVPDPGGHRRGRGGQPLMGFDKNDIMRAVELAVLGIVGVLMIFFVARPLLGGGKGKGGAPGGGGLIAAGPMAQRVMVSPDGQPMQLAADGSGQLALPGPDGESRIDMARVDGQVRASAVKKVSEFVERHPDESVAILRSWLHETT